jgi:hypothetical protein
VNDALLNDSSSLRKRRRIVFIVTSILLTLFVFASGFCNSYAHLVFPDYVHDIDIDVDGLEPDAAGLIAVSYRSHWLPEMVAPRLGASFHWRIQDCLVTQLRLHVADSLLEKIKSVHVEIGTRSRTFAPQEVFAWEHLPPKPWVLRDSAQKVQSLVIPCPTKRIAINLVEGAGLMLHVALPGLGFASAFWCLLLSIDAIVDRPFFEPFVIKLLCGSPAADGEGKGRSRAPFAIGICVTIIGLCLTYTIEPYPFTQDDNLSQFLPVMLRSAQTLCQGQFPTWNPYQMLGGPTATVGYYALTYPIVYVCYFLSHFLFHNDFLLLELFAWFHLVLGYVAAYWALRQSRVSQTIAATGGFCWALCGWFLVAGRGQYNFNPYCLFLPLAIGAVNYLVSRDVSWKWMFATGALIGVMFHAGHAEFWFYTMMFCALSTMLFFFSGQVPARRMLWMLAAVCVGLGLAAPLLIPQKMEARHVVRTAGEGWNSDFLHMLLPLGSIGSGEQVVGNTKSVSEMFYSGTLFSGVAIGALCLLILSVLLRPQYAKHRLYRSNIWLLCGGIAFILAMGPSGVAWAGLSLLPPFNQFRWPVKYSLFVDVFFIFGGALVLERMLKDSARIRYGIMVGVAFLMLFHVTLCRSSWYSFSDRPYPRLETERWLKAKPEQRVFEIAPYRSTSQNFVNCLSLNFGTVYQILSFGGYDWIVETHPQYAAAEKKFGYDPVGAARAYGIGWVVRSALTDFPVLSANKLLSRVESVDTAGCYFGWVLADRSPPVYESSTLRLYRVAKPDPIVFKTGDPASPLPYDLDQAGITVHTTGLPAGTKITANFLQLPWISAEANGKTFKENFKPSADEWQRIQITMPEPAVEVHIRYAPPWIIFILIGAVLIGTGIVFGFIAQAQMKKND